VKGNVNISISVDKRSFITFVQSGILDLLKTDLGDAIIPPPNLTELLSNMVFPMKFRVMFDA